MNTSPNSTNIKHLKFNDHSFNVFINTISSLHIMVTFNNIPEELREVLFDQAVRSQSSDHLSIRDVGRYFEISSLLFTSKRLNGLFFNNIKKLHIDAIENSFLRSWKQVTSFLRRCSHSLQSLTLENVCYDDNDDNDSTSSSSSDDDADAMDIEDPSVSEEAEEWDGFNLPNLTSLEIVACSGEESIKILKAVPQHKLQGLHLDMSRVTIPSQSHTKDFLSRELLGFLQTNHSSLQELKLIKIPMGRESVRTPLNDLFGNLESLSLIELEFDEAPTATELLRKLKAKCTKLSSLSLRVAHVAFEAIKELCISRKMTLKKLRVSQQLSSGEISDWEMYNIIDDCKALTCLEIGGIEYVDMNMVPVEGPLTSKWAEYAVNKIGSQLETLGMSYTRIDKKLLTKIATECRVIKSLCFKFCSIEDDCTEEFSKLLENVESTLEELELQACDSIAGEHLEILRDRFKYSSLRTLRLGHVAYHTTEDEFVNFMKQFGSNLEELEVYECFEEDENPLTVLDAVVKHCNPEKLERLTILSPPPENVGEVMGGKLVQARKLFDQVVIEPVPEDSFPRRKTFL